MKIDLSPEAKQKLESRHKQVRDVRESDRIKAVLLSSENWSVFQISQALRKHESTILRHLTDYKKSQKLTTKNGGSQSHLNSKQTDELTNHLLDITYVHVHQIVAYVQLTYNIKYSASGMTQWLHQNGFSYKQPKGVPHKFDPEKQAQFIDEYKVLKASLTADEPLLFMDAVHPTQATKVTSGWIKTGVDKPIETTGSQTRLNIIGAIELGHLDEAISHPYKTINSESIVDFFKQIK